MAAKVKRDIVDVQNIPLTKLPDEEDQETIEMLNKLKSTSLTETEKKLKQAQTDQTGNPTHSKEEAIIKENGSKKKEKEVKPVMDEEDVDENGLPNQIIETDYEKPEHNVSKKKDKFKPDQRRDEIDPDNIDTTAQPLPKEVEEGNIEYKVF
jgi:hypothetical protein